MELDMDITALGALWLPSFEADSFNTFVTESQEYHAGLNNAEYRRKLASELLEALEGSEIQQDEPYCGWLEEPMDLEVFGQSLEDTSVPLNDEDSFIFSAPSSPLVSLPPTPFQPTSPQELYPPQEDLPVVKFEESSTVVPAESEELLESLELLLHQIQAEAEESSASPSPVEQPVEVQIEPENEEDVASALLDSLIKGDVEECQVLDELAEFSLALMGTEQVEPNHSISSSTSESDDLDWTPPPSIRSKSRAGTSTPARRPRKKSLKPEDRRVRKKEQNKTAATRYRIKKKAELEILLEEEARLEERNQVLQSRHDELANEVRYLKKLMREVLIGKSGKRR